MAGSVLAVILGRPNLGRPALGGGSVDQPDEEQLPAILAVIIQLGRPVAPDDLARPPSAIEIPLTGAKRTCRYGAPRTGFDIGSHSRVANLRLFDHPVGAGEAKYSRTFASNWRGLMGLET